jgi:hypothetical protein
MVAGTTVIGWPRVGQERNGSEEDTAPEVCRSTVAARARTLRPRGRLGTLLAVSVIAVAVIAIVAAAFWWWPSEGRRSPGTRWPRWWPSRARREAPVAHSTMPAGSPFLEPVNIEVGRLVKRLEAEASR